MTIERFKPKTFTVPTEHGPEEAIQHATFTFYIQRTQFRFVVTQLGFGAMTVTHRLTGKRICDITHTPLAACCNSAKDAGKLALSQFIERIGEAKVRAVLAAAEGLK